MAEVTGTYNSGISAWVTYDKDTDKMTYNLVPYRNTELIQDRLYSNNQNFLNGIKDFILLTKI